MPRWDIPERAQARLLAADALVGEAQRRFADVMAAIAAVLDVPAEAQLSPDGKYFFVPEVEAPPETGQNGHQNSAALEAALSSPGETP